MTMAHGLELRLPFLDKDLVALMAQVPGQLKLRNGRSKYLLKRAMKNILPAYVLRRRKKGLNPPMGIWIENQLKEKVDEYLGEAAVKSRGYFNHGFISKLRHIHRCGKRDLSLHLWALVVLEEWHREYLDH
jgi:asparagine synthase (glutamine-hydrolysing)